MLNRGSTITSVAPTSGLIYLEDEKLQIHDWIQFLDASRTSWQFHCRDNAGGLHMAAGAFIGFIIPFLTKILAPRDGFARDFATLISTVALSLPIFHLNHKHELRNVHTPPQDPTSILARTSFKGAMAFRDLRLS